MMMTLKRLTLAALTLTVAVGCTDLTVQPKSTVTGANIFNDANAYKSFLARVYAGLSVSGQEGPAGRGDIAGIDEGFSQYLRLYWQMQELPTDEAVIAWNDAGVQELNTQIWSPSNQFLVAMYYRVFFQVSLANEFLRETSDAKLDERRVNSPLRAEIKQMRAEARFLRALSLYHGLDLFGNIPIVTEADALNSAPPKQKTAAEVFAYVEQELLAIKGDLPAVGAAQYGRVDQGAVAMLLGKLYLNAEVYTGSGRYADARTQMEQVIAGPYQLEPDYDELFTADNNTTKEIIFPITFDGMNTRSWGGMTFLVHAAVGGNMNAGNWGIDFGWWGLRAQPEFVNRFAGGPNGPDERSQFFFTSGHAMQIGNLTDFFQGIPYPKFTNKTSSGSNGQHMTFPDTDFPMFRLADAYLMYAEAVLRGGGGSRATALNYVNQLRQRAFNGTSGNITDAQLTLDFILDERSRELGWEAHRRQDLIRYGRFTTSGIWQWKGGVQAGKTTEAFRRLYPLPGSEILANPNLTQNPGYGN